MWFGEFEENQFTFVTASRSTRCAPLWRDAEPSPIPAQGAFTIGRARCWEKTGGTRCCDQRHGQQLLKLHPPVPSRDEGQASSVGMMTHGVEDGLEGGPSLWPLQMAFAHNAVRPAAKHQHSILSGLGPCVDAFRPCWHLGWRSVQISVVWCVVCAGGGCGGGEDEEGGGRERERKATVIKYDQSNTRERSIPTLA